MILRKLILVVMIGSSAQNLCALSISDVLNENNSRDQQTEFSRATIVREFSFPEDHMPHPDFQTEWWYLTGNLEELETGRHFGYQFTLFRFALEPGKKELNHQHSSAWRTDQIYMGHLALTDSQNQKHYTSEIMRRGALGMAGVAFDDESLMQSWRLWIDNWTLRSEKQESWLPLVFQAGNSEFSLELVLEREKPIVLQGNQGLSQKSAEPGNASYYYSLTRLRTSGIVMLGNKPYKVSGNSWLDREWSTSALSKDQQGWDWFALHLEDGRDLMIYQLRKKDGSADSFSSGVIIDKQGNRSQLAYRDFTLRPFRYWISSDTGRKWPVQWKVVVPGEAIDFQVTARIEDQEWKGDFNYWEGAVTATDADGNLRAAGYLEMTGY